MTLLISIPIYDFVQSIFEDTGVPTLVVGYIEETIEEIIRKMERYQLVSLPLFSGQVSEFRILGRVSLFEIMQYYYQSSKEIVRLYKPISNILKFN
jgi:hypothetical protein